MEQLVGALSYHQVFLQDTKGMGHYVLRLFGIQIPPIQSQPHHKR